VGRLQVVGNQEDGAASHEPRQPFPDDCRVRRIEVVRMGETDRSEERS
jgi:hypothetical protein